jgi:hypothetical protein
MTTENDCRGCPDWSDATAYPTSSEQLEDWQWRWEFLRRNPAYREAWKRAETYPETKDAIYWDESMRLCGFPSEPDKVIVEHGWHMGKRLLNPKTSLDSIGKESIFHNDNSAQLWLPILRYSIIEKYLEKNNFSLERQVKILMTYLKHVLTLLEIQNDKKVFLAKFDLTKKITPQIEKTKKEIETKLEGLDIPIQSMNQNRRENWVRHLRVIDAKDQGASHKEIYDHFADESAGGDEDALDEFYREGRQPKPVVNGWYSQAKEVMGKVSLLV